jgi:hypothetical protein
VSIDTSKADTHTVTLKASGGLTTLFQNNLVNGNSTNSNSIAFRNILDDSTSNANAVLKIDTGSNEEGEKGTGTVALVDPIWVELDGDKTFTVTVSGEGNFLWGGKNEVTAAGGSITLGGGTTKLLSDFKLNVSSTHEVSVVSEATLDFEEGADLKVKGMTIESGGTLSIDADMGSWLTSQTNALSGGSLRLTGDKVTCSQDWTLNDEDGNTIEVGLAEDKTPLEAILSGKLIGTGGFTKTDTGTLILNHSENSVGAVEDDRRSEAEVISGTAALYGGKELPAGPGALRVLLAGAISRHDVESKRRVQTETQNQQLKTPLHRQDPEHFA